MLKGRLDPLDLLPWLRLWAGQNWGDVTIKIIMEIFTFWQLQRYTERIPL